VRLLTLRLTISLIVGITPISLFSAYYEERSAQSILLTIHRTMYIVSGPNSASEMNMFHRAWESIKRELARLRKEAMISGSRFQVNLDQANPSLACYRDHWGGYHLLLFQVL
jgi:hypothetical protein